MNRSWGIAALILMAGATGCSDEVTFVECTGIGCDDGLAVVLDGYDGAEGKLIVEVPGGPPMVVECDSRCGRVFLPEFTPAEVAITFTIGDRSVEHMAAPEYQIHHPNGEHCAPECLHATVHIDVSGIAEG